MTKMKKLVVSGLFVSLASTVTVAHAEGFFSNLFGGSSSGVSFKSMLSHVPADTAYMFANEKPLPSEVMDFHIKRSEGIFKMYSKMLYKQDKSSDDKDKPVDKSRAFFEAIMNELSAKLADKKFEETGFSLKAHSLIYGYDEMPVVRLSIADKEKLMEMIKRAEEESGYSVKFGKCGEFECFKKISEKKSEPSFAVVLLKNQIALSLFSKDKADAVINHLIGKADPKKAYDEDKWEDFLKENDYKGYGDGFVNWKKLYNSHKEDFAKGFFQKKKLSEDEKKACISVIDDHVDNMPGLLYGSKSLKAKSADYEVVLQTSSEVSKALATLANKSNIAQRTVNPILDIGINMDFKQLSVAMTQYSKFLIASGEKHKCTAIDAKEIRKGMGGMLMGMNMGLAQFKSIYVSLNDLELGERMQPKKLDVLVSLGSDDPSGLLAMGAMFSPGLAKLKVPNDGTAVKIPAGVIPSKGLPLPPMSISRSDKSINLMIGNDKPELKDYKGTKPEIMTFAIDGKRYYEILGSVMKNVAPSKDNDMGDLMSNLGNMMGYVKEEVHADKRGLIIDAHIQY